MHEAAAPAITTLFWPAVNFLILLGILGYKLRKPFSDFVRNRHVSLQEELHSVAERLHQAQLRFDDLTARLKALDSEIVAIREQSKQDADETRVRILADAKRLAGVIVSDARIGADSFFVDLRSGLRSEAAAKVVDRAEEILRGQLTAADRIRIRRDFSQHVEAM
jgi:F-type H+-transporting ATPase subunit b